MMYIIGVGGVGSFLAEAMVRLVDPMMVTLIDGDELEKKNLDRQLFTADQIGQNKAVALSQKLGCRGMDKFYNPHLIDMSEDDWLMGCVDNNPARRAILSTVDAYGCRAIIAANEVHSSEAYTYTAMWYDSPELDPRRYYPEIETDNSGNPEAARIGCTGEAQQNNRQLVTANFMAAALAAHLYVLWGMERHKYDNDAVNNFPFRLRQNLTRNEYTSYVTVMKERENAESR